MVSEKMDRAKLLAYVLGELDRDETLAIAKKVEQDADLKNEVLSMQKMTQKLDEAFVVSEDFSLKASQLQRIRLKAHHRATRKKWVIWASALATVVIVMATMMKQQQQERMAATPIPQIISMAPPAFEPKVVPPPETSWEEQLAVGNAPAQGVAMNDKAIEQFQAPALPAKKSRAQEIAPESKGAQALSKSQALAGAKAKRPDKTGLLNAFGSGGVPTSQTVVGLAEPMPPAAAPPPPADAFAKNDNSLVGANGMVESEMSAIGNLESAGDHFAAAEAPRALAPQKAEGRVDLRVAVDRRLSTVPPAFAGNLLDMLVRNLNGASDCFQSHPIPPRVDMTVEVSGKGDILSVNLIPQVPNNERSILCLMQKVNRVGSLLKPKNNKNASFEIRLNLK